MKYVKIDPFEKALEESLPDHPSELYFILMEDPFERSFLAKGICRKIGLNIIHCESENLVKELESPSLFSEKQILVCDTPTEKEIPRTNGLIMIFTGKSAPPFYKEKEKIGTTLDLSGEKPWDRKKRLQRWLLERAREKGKTLTGDGVAYLLDFSHADFATLFQELDKAVVYSGEEKILTLEMIKTICTIDPVQDGWQLSEAVVLGGLIYFGETDLYALIGQLRYQLQLGLQISLAKEPAKISPKKLERFQKAHLKTAFFMEGLKDLFDLEMKMRSNISNQGLLFDQFRAKLAVRR